MQERTSERMVQAVNLVMVLAVVLFAAAVVMVAMTLRGDSAEEDNVAASPSTVAERRATQVEILSHAGTTWFATKAEEDAEDSAQCKSGTLSSGLRSSAQRTSYVGELSAFAGPDGRVAFSASCAAGLTGLWVSDGGQTLREIDRSFLSINTSTIGWRGTHFAAFMDGELVGLDSAEGPTRLFDALEPGFATIDTSDVDDLQVAIAYPKDWQWDFGIEGHASDAGSFVVADVGVSGAFAAFRSGTEDPVLIPVRQSSAGISYVEAIDTKDSTGIHRHIDLGYASILITVAVAEDEDTPGFPEAFLDLVRIVDNVPGGRLLPRPGSPPGTLAALPVELQMGRVFEVTIDFGPFGTPEDQVFVAPDQPITSGAEGIALRTTTNAQLLDDQQAIMISAPETCPDLCTTRVWLTGGRSFATLNTGATLNFYTREFTNAVVTITPIAALPSEAYR